MRPRSDGFPARALVTVLAIAWMLGIGLSAAERRTPTAPAKASAAKSAPPSAQTPQASADDYVGQDTCLTCHDSQGYKGTMHAMVSEPEIPRRHARLRELSRSREGCTSTAAATRRRSSTSRR